MTQEFLNEQIKGQIDNLKTLKSNLENSIKELEALLNPDFKNLIGQNFYHWAEEFFSFQSGNLNRYLQLYYVTAKYQFDMGIIDADPNKIVKQLGAYAKFKKMTLIQDGNGRICLETYDQETIEQVFDTTT